MQFKHLPEPTSEVSCNATDLSLQILTLRQEKAKLLGFNNFAELSMSKKVGGAGELVCVSHF